MAHTYSHLFGLPTTGLRFFTVYGPWGRPDMALFMFTKAIIAGEPIKVFNHGRMVRDFTFIDDIAEGVLRTLDRPPERDADYNSASADPARSGAPYRVFNIGNHDPVPLLDFIAAIERQVGRAAVKDFQDIQPGDVPATHADVAALAEWTGFRPATSIDEGVGRFVTWYRGYFAV
jgi:UDP-glucuronate 4-epimerase